MALRGLRRARVLYTSGALLLVAFGYLCYELGRYRAGYSLFDHRRAVEELQTQLDAERRSKEELGRQVAILETSREIDRETYARVEENLSQLEAQIQTLEEELAFYRGIVSPQDGHSGLRVHNVEIEALDGERAYALRLVLVQAIVHSRQVKGVVRFRIEGTRDGQPEELELAELDDEGPAELEYEFRYFQELEREVVLPAGFEPARVHVEIRPSEPRGERVTQTFEWAATPGG
ncbi:MAG TPA: DUF6776 family protein [Gammaproteobacteria bacterium]